MTFPDDGWHKSVQRFMNIPMSKAELRTRLDEIGVRPSKMLGQNFLLDTNLAKAIVADLEPSEWDHLVEVGPGMGALTVHILASPARRITLIERDHRLAAELTDRYAIEIASGRLEIRRGDGAKTDLISLYGYGPVKMVGNLPYSASTAIISHFTSAISPACRLVLMVQREVADRLAAAPGHKDYAALTVQLGRRWSVRKLRLVPPDVFWPRPAVESAVIKVSPRAVADLPNCHPGGFSALVRQGFSSRRKQLRSLLKLPAGVWEKWSVFKGHPVTARAEDLPVDHWAELALHVTPEGHDHPGEMCDVVDSEDRILESRLRSEVHVNNSLHRAVHLWIFNSRGELFLQKRSPWKLNHPDQWCSSAAGHVDTGETYEVAAHREMREEIGVDCPLVKFWKVGATEETGHEFVEYLVGLHEGPFTFATGEVETGAFFPVEQIRRWVERTPEDFTPLFKMAASRFLHETESLIKLASGT
jgi:16S rRNA (adenine1518-N6/adenine1519-N6)-dimethyltransferase